MPLNYLDDSAATWDQVPQLELTDPVEGGPDGADNRAPKALANRTKYLKNVLDKGIQAAAPGGFDPTVAPLVGDLRRLVVVDGGAGAVPASYIAVTLADDTRSWLKIF